MGVYIKGMKMPTSCYDCPCNKDDGFGFFTCGVTKTECDFIRLPSNCPLVPVPPHGRLIDADEPISLVDTHGEKVEVTVAHIIEKNRGVVKAVIPASEGGRDMSRFPKDCWNKDCEHFHVTDMSIDDLLCACDVNGMECDACDEDFCFVRCPLTEEGE